MTVTPIPNEPGRFHVTSETDNLPWLVDVRAPLGEPQCACAIEHNRTPTRYRCKHVAAAYRYLAALATSPAVPLP